MHSHTQLLRLIGTKGALALGGTSARAQGQPRDHPSAEVHNLAFMTGR